jgi:hypothetical protein
MAKPRKISNYAERAALFLIGRTQRPIILEIEIARKAIPQFIKDYSEWTGRLGHGRSLRRRGSQLTVEQVNGAWNAVYIL